MDVTKFQQATLETILRSPPILEACSRECLRLARTGHLSQDQCQELLALHETLLAKANDPEF